MTDPGDPGPGDGDPSASELIVEVRVDPGAEELTRTLGWTSGVPGAEVRILRNGTRDWTSGTTGEDGRAVFSGVLPGLYRVVAARTLTATEADGADGRIRAFADGGTFQVPAGSTRLELGVAEDRVGDLVIGELGYGRPPSWELDNNVSRGGLFFEVYNNSASTLFLDGLVFGVGQPHHSDGVNSCSSTEPVREDPSGIIFRLALAFPGSGTEYPIGPGELRLVAMVAADQSDLHPAMPDLSGADFEIGASGLADNPSVPNMRDVGIDPITAPARWTALLANRFVYFLADPFDPQQLPIVWRDVKGFGYLKAPAEAMRDVVATSNIRPENDLEFPPCFPVVHRSFDRYEAVQQAGFDVDASEKAFESFQRRVLRSEGGRLILQDTNTSAVDFEVGTKTPGSISGRGDG